LHLTPIGLERLLRRAGFAEPRVGTATTADGMPMSLEYRKFGHRRFDRGASRYATVAASLLAAPVTVALDHLAGGGDVVHAVAVKR
jgi:hypothetical protein